MTLSESEQQDLGLRVGTVFTPAVPIDQKRLFAGRTQQLRTVVDAIIQRGQHAIVYGERGVGKTSLANVLSAFLSGPAQKTPILAPKVNCVGSDDYSSLWRKVLGGIEIVSESRQWGFKGEISQQVHSLADTLKGEITPDHVRQILSQLGSQAMLIVIIDEFDRLANGNLTRIFADTIKMLSDYSVPATLILVGVADSVTELIVEHESIERALIQVHMPRMSKPELDEIVNKGLSELSATGNRHRFKKNYRGPRRGGCVGGYIRRPTDDQGCVSQSYDEYTQRSPLSSGIARLCAGRDRRTRLLRVWGREDAAQPNNGETIRHTSIRTPPKRLLRH
jgi:Cdc6-like AAA superfamily ATPase